MSPLIAIILEVLIVVAGAIGLGIFLRRRLPERWSAWFAGGLAFVASQLVRLPLLSAFAAALPLLGIGPTHTAYLPILISVQLASSGLFEETARYIVMRWLIKRVRDWKSGVMFGAGHGGVEAILVIGLASVNVIALLAFGDSLLAQTQAAAPAQVPALQAQIEAVRGMQWWAPVLGVYERVGAVMLHISLSLLVMKAVRGDNGRRAWLWWLLAVVFHAGANTVAVGVNQIAGPFAAEGVLTFIAAIAVVIIARVRRAEQAANT
ncbi:MAG: YhfC family glutamic-type intramembrane protease, partial [Thermoflexales bacterium]